MNYRSFISKINQVILLIMAFSLMLYSSVMAQNQKLSDSLETIINGGNYDETTKLNLLKQLSIDHPETEKKLAYAEELLTLAKALDSNQYYSTAYLEKGNALFQKGDYPLAIESYLSARDIAFKKNGEKYDNSGFIFATIATCYDAMDQKNMAIKYYQQAINISEKVKDTTFLATCFENLGYTYLGMKVADSALFYFNKSGLLFEKINHEIGLAYNQANKGLAWAELGNFAKAGSNINAAIETMEKFGHNRAISELLIESSEIYLLNNKTELAFDVAYRGLNIAEANNFKLQISQANLQLSKIYETRETTNKSLGFYKTYIIYRDSIHNPASIQEIADMRADFEISLKQTELDLNETELDLKHSEVELLNQQKSNLRILAFSMIALLGLTSFYFRNIRKSKRRSDDLLLNILPRTTAKELKEHGKVKAKKFDSVSIMFTDFQAFTRYSQKLSPEVLVKSVDFYFSKFDEIIEKHKLEKIKTIGDAYMCAEGLHLKSTDQCQNIIHAAFEISSFMNKAKTADLGELAHFDIRIGINTGPVVAGVVGKKKFAYDIWGDAVNVASRMETNSEVGKINISENTYQLIKNDFNCTYRGEIEVKNKGLMPMYFVETKKEAQVLQKVHSLTTRRSAQKTIVPI